MSIPDSIVQILPPPYKVPARDSPWVSEGPASIYNFTSTFNASHKRVIAYQNYIYIAKVHCLKTCVSIAFGAPMQSPDLVLTLHYASKMCNGRLK